MTSTPFDEQNNLATAENYYKAMLAKNFRTMATFIHEDVYFRGPLAEMHGKEAVVLAAKNFGEQLHDIQIRSRFASHHQVMFAYDMVVSAPVGKFQAAVLMTFKDHLISQIELFYDARPFVEKKSEIFG